VPRTPIPSPQALDDTGQRKVRRRLLRELTDLYLEKPSHTAEEEALYTELALRLIEHVDAAERARLGARLTSYPAAPRAVLHRLAQCETEERTAAQGINARTLPRLETARQDDLTDSFFDASPEERRLILLHLDHAATTPAAIWPLGDPLMRLERAALTREPDQLATVLADMLAIPRTCADRIVHDMSGEGLIAACKALDIPAPALPRILLFLPSIANASGRYFALLRLYDEMSHSSARRLVTIWRGTHAMYPQQTRPLATASDNRLARARDFARHPARPSEQPIQSPDRDHPRRNGNDG
jgi:uncharacterized protein (DUF2336 family)